MNDFAIDPVHASPYLFAKPFPHPTGLPYNLLQPWMDQTQLKHPLQDPLGDQHQQDNGISQAIEAKMKPKKKKKLNNGDVGSGEPSSPKIKKTKGDGKK